MHRVRNRTPLLVVLVEVATPPALVARLGWRPPTLAFTVEHPERVPHPIAESADRLLEGLLDPARPRQQPRTRDARHTRLGAGDERFVNRVRTLGRRQEAARGIYVAKDDALRHRERARRLRSQDRTHDCRP